MFNSYNYETQNITKVNAVTGMIQKQYKDSFILRFDVNSNYEEKIFSLSPYITINNPNYYKLDNCGHRISYSEKIDKEVVVLQVMLCGADRYIVELMWKEDFDKLFLNNVIEDEMEGNGDK